MTEKKLENEIAKETARDMAEKWGGDAEKIYSDLIEAPSYEQSISNQKREKELRFRLGSAANSFELKKVLDDMNELEKVKFYKVGVLTADQIGIEEDFGEFPLMAEEWDYSQKDRTAMNDFISGDFSALSRMSEKQVKMIASQGLLPEAIEDKLLVPVKIEDMKAEAEQQLAKKWGKITQEQYNDFITEREKSKKSASAEVKEDLEEPLTDANILESLEKTRQDILKTKEDLLDTEIDYYKEKNNQNDW